MKLNETYNIHKKINCIFPSFKSQFLCKKGIHNYRINPIVKFIPQTFIERTSINDYEIEKVTNYLRIDETNLKCFCCGKEEKFDE